MIDDYKKDMNSAREFAQQATVISTKDKDTDKDEKKEEEEEKERNEPKNHLKYNKNQKIQLCIAMLEVRCIEDRNS